jgi:hypothetical protein
MKKRILIVATVAIACVDVPEKDSPMAPMLALEESPSEACAYGTAWFRNGHLHSSSTFSAPAVCWEYAGGTNITVIATYAALSSEDHGDGESHRWYTKSLDYIGDRSADSTYLKQANRDADEFYTDTLSITLPTNGGEGVTVYLLFEDEDEYNFWIEIYTILTAPSGLDASLLGSTAALSWTNAESGTGVTTQVYRSVNAVGWNLDTTVANGVNSVVRSGLAWESTYRYQVRHRSTSAGQIGYTRLSNWSGTDSVMTESQPDPLTVSITGPDEVEPNVTCAWTSSVSGGIPETYGYTWKKGTSVVSTDASLEMDTGTTSFTLTLIVTSDGVAPDTATHAVTVSGSAGVCPGL